MTNMTISIIGYVIAVVMLAVLIGGAVIWTNKKVKKNRPACSEKAKG